MLDTYTNNGHSLISPSGAHRWAICAGSVRLTMNEKQTTNDRAQRGTDIHQLGEALLKGQEFIVGTSVLRDGNNGMFYANADMLDEATRYCNYVKALATEPTAEIIAEAHVSILPEYDVSGHVDATVINGNELHIIDLKTGAGAVSAEENLQMQLYALGTLDEHSLFYDFEKVVLHIVQDNASISNTNSWETTPEDLEDFREWITERARLALQEDSVCTPTEKACQWCSHASKCEALANAVTDMFEELDEREVLGTTADELTLETITGLLERRGLFDRAMKAYEQRIMDELHQGNEVKGYKLVLGRKNKKWVNENEAYDKLTKWLPIDEVAPRKLVSPTQAEKLLGKEVSTRKKNIFEELYEKPDGQPQLAPSSDKRPAYIPNTEFEEL